MHFSYNTILAAASIISIASAAPAPQTHANPQNGAPAGNPAPIAQPAVNSLDACLAACKGNPACIAYTFQNGVCKLFGATVGRRQAQGTHANPQNAAPAGNPTPLAQPAVNSLDACLAACKGNPACIAYTFENGVCKLFGPTVGRRQQQNGGAKAGANTPATGNNNGNQGTHASPVNSVPAGNPAPLATPAVNSLDACLAACKGNPSCIAYTFESGVCKLFGSTVGRRQQQNGGANTGANTPSTGKTPTTGANTPATGNNNGNQGTHASPVNSVPAGSPAPIAQPAVNSLDACLAACKGNPACIAYTFESGVCKLFA